MGGWNSNVEGWKPNLFQPFLVLFILYSLEKLIEGLEGQMLCVFLKPIIQEFEVAFFDGFEMSYAYPFDFISPHLFHVDGEPLRLQAILMLWTKDHLTQCLVDGFKNGWLPCLLAWSCERSSLWTQGDLSKQ